MSWTEKAEAVKAANDKIAADRQRFEDMLMSLKKAADSMTKVPTLVQLKEFLETVKKVLQSLDIKNK